MKHFRFGADYLHPEFKQFVFAFHLPTAAAAVAGGQAAVAPAGKTN
jgi:hypothetical protein